MVIRHRNEMASSLMERMRGGDGSVRVTHILNPDEMFGKGRLFAENIVPPGASIGLHKHEGDSEAYFFLEGTGEYQDNEVSYAVRAGDLTVVADGDSHGIRNTGAEPLRFIALILFTGGEK